MVNLLPIFKLKSWKFFIYFPQKIFSVVKNLFFFAKEMENSREIESLKKLIKSLEEKISEKDLIIDECKARMRDD